MKYYMGIDGGGTKSRLLVIDKNYNIIGNAFGGSTNIASNSREYVYNNLKKLLGEFLANNRLEIDDCLGICIGSAGIDSKSSGLAMEQIIKDISFTCRIISINDSLLALAAGAKGGPGVVVISGTGSIAYGMDSNENTIRCGGWGHILDDGGSGYWIGKEALKSALRSCDGRGEKTILEEVFKEVFHVTHLPDCIDSIYNGFDKARIAGYAVFVKEGADKKDNVCMEIIDRGAKELFTLADTVIKRMDENAPKVIVSGGTILNNDSLLSSFRGYMAKYYPNTTVLKLDKEPVLGAIHLIVNDTGKGVDIKNYENY